MRRRTEDRKWGGLVNQAKDFCNRAIEQVAQIGEQVVQNLDDIVDDMSTDPRKLGNNLFQNAKQFANQVGKKVEKTGVTVDKFLQNQQAGINRLNDKVNDSIGKIFDNKSMWTKIADFFKDLGKSIKSAFSSVKEEVMDLRSSKSFKL